MTRTDVLRAAPAALLVLGLALAGCTAGVSGTAVPAGNAPDAPHTGGQSSVAERPLVAADGTNYAVCARRSCEVTVSAAARIRFGGQVPGTLSITKVTSTGLRAKLKLESGSNGTLSLSPGCGSTFITANGGGSLVTNDRSCTHRRLAVRSGAVSFQMPPGADGRVLRIATGT